MKRKLKLITGLSTVALTGALALGGCGGEGEGEGEGAAEGDNSALQGEGSVEGEGGYAQSEGEGESEGEGGTRTGDPATDDVEYLYRLGLIRGHLSAFIELYRSGNFEMAAMHVKHPEDEIYQELKPAFTARGVAGFEDRLTTLVEAAENKSQVEETYSSTILALTANMPPEDAKTKLLAVAALTTSAADEFKVGVDDSGAVVEPHEYQDAYGFLIAAREILANADTSDINASEAVAIAHEQIDLALTAFEGLVTDQTEGDASTIYGAASRIEIAALGL